MLVVFALLHVARGETDALLLDVAGSSKRCIGENFAESGLGKWSFQVQDASKVPTKESKVRVTVKDPTKKLLYSAALTYEEAFFPFTAKVPGLHKACLQNHATKSQRVQLKVTQGFSVKEYGSLVDEHYGPISKQLDDAKVIIADIADEMDASLQREQDERQEAMVRPFSFFFTSSSSQETEARIANMGYVSMAVLIGLALWQIIYLRSFFRSKKLL